MSPVSAVKVVCVVYCTEHQVLVKAERRFIKLPPGVNVKGEEYISRKAILAKFVSVVSLNAAEAKLPAALPVCHPWQCF